MYIHRSILTEMVLLALLLSWSEQAPLQTSHGLSRRSSCSNPHIPCSSSKQTPAFYSHCIESIFRCKEDSFALSYGQRRITTLLEELDSELSQDSTGQALNNYLHKSEICFQDALESAARSLALTSNPNPHTCLALETHSLELLNQCYHLPELCTVLDTADSSLESHLTRIVSAFRLGGDYYNSTMVDSGLPQAVMDCGHSELAKNLISKQLPVKVNWCATGNNFLTMRVPAPTEFITVLSSKLNRSMDQFVYSGLDNPTARICSTTENQHVFSWLASPDDPLLLEVHSQGVITSRDLHRNFEFRAHQDVSPSQCGDGIRQAGETCDYLDNLDSCDTSCAVKPGYQCSTTPLTQSDCSVAPPTIEEVLCSPRTRSRSRAGVQGTSVVSLPSVSPALTGSASNARTLSAVTMLALVLLSLVL